MNFSLDPIAVKGKGCKIFALTINGKCKSKEFLEMLEKKHPNIHEKFMGYIEYSSLYGFITNSKQFNCLKKSAWEFKDNSLAFRLYCYFAGPGTKEIILLFGSEKRTGQGKKQDTDVKTAQDLCSQISKMLSKN